MLLTDILLRDMARFHLLRYVIIFCFLIPASTLQASGQVRIKPRVIILTDISSLSRVEGEPDDGQSLIRLMLYTNEMEVEGLLATSNLGHGQRTRPELIKQVVETYGLVRSNLLLHHRDYPHSDQLLSVIKQGQPIAGPRLNRNESIGEGKDTEASDWIIHVADKNDPRPVWILIWGGSADLAQALWKVKATRGQEAVAKFISKLRVHAVYDQDQTASWIKSSFPDLFYIFRHHGIRGMYRGGDTTLVRSRWVETNIRNHHGALGALYVNYNGGDIWSGRLGRVSGIKEGDSPSFLNLPGNGLNAPEHPEWGSWSGRFKRDSTQANLWVEAVDSVDNYKTDPDPRMAALHRWRAAWQADFAARMDWCTSAYDDANHAPRFADVKVRELTVSAGKQIKLTSPKASDPDNDALDYKWYFYAGAGSYHGTLPQLSTKETVAIFTAPTVLSPQSIHIILEVTDNGKPALTAYKRFIVRVRP